MRNQRLRQGNIGLISIKILFLVLLLIFLLFPFYITKYFVKRNFLHNTTYAVSDSYIDGVWFESSDSPELDFRYSYTPKQINIAVDGDSKKITIAAIDIKSALDKSGTVLGEFDIVKPSLDMPLQDGLTVEVVRVNKVLDTREVTVPMRIEYKKNNEMYLGEERVVQDGCDGKMEQKVEKVFEDGILVSEKILIEEIVSYEKSKIIEQGTKVKVSATTYGIASYYVHPGYKGQLITAHNTYPFGSKLRITNLRNGKSVIVKVVDRGIQSPDRVVDLSKTAFQQIEDTWYGLARVKVELIAN